VESRALPANERKRVRSRTRQTVNLHPAGLSDRFSGMGVADVILVVAMALTALVAAVTDVRRQKIYNWLTYPALLFGLVVQAIGHGWGTIFGLGLVSALSGALFCGVVFGVFAYWRRGFGMGDVKLLAALGAQAGLLPVLYLVMFATLLGALLSLLWVGVGLIRGGGNPDPAGSGLPRVPYAVAIALGTLAAIAVRLDWLHLP